MPRTRKPGRPPKPKRHRDIKCRQVYHLYQRGSQGQRVFRSDLERILYLQQVFLVAKRYRVRVHNFVLMQTHVHFIVEQTRKFAVSRMMRDLQGNHARKCNQRLETYGHLWVNHFKAKLVTSETYYQTLMWYVSHNPVKAGYCRRAVDYRWSGASALTRGGSCLITLGKLEARINLYMQRFDRTFQPAPGGRFFDAELPKELAGQVAAVELILDRYALLEKRELERLAWKNLAKMPPEAPLVRKAPAKRRASKATQIASG